jgi:hydrogenase/urease accessory protein HupE
LTVTANLFPHDGLAKIFVTVSRGGKLAGQYALDRADPAITIADQSLGAVILEFVGQGVRHIFIGPDHILFVISLVLLGGRLATQVKIITAFTLAHSTTLTLATLGLVDPPPRLVESLIALSIVLVGLHNLWRLRRSLSVAPELDPRAALAFGFGLVHGFGFAHVLSELELPRQALAWSLAAFNIGVEIGQAAIVLTAAPLLLALKRRAPPPVARAVLTTIAAAVVLMGGFWFVQRALGA